jgi:hypothetical protein
MYFCEGGILVWDSTNTSGCVIEIWFVSLSRILDSRPGAPLSTHQGINPAEPGACWGGERVVVPVWARQLSPRSFCIEAGRCGLGRLAPAQMENIVLYLSRPIHVF